MKSKFREIGRLDHAEMSEEALCVRLVGHLGRVLELNS